VDFNDSALALAADFRRAKEAGAVDDRHILGSIGDVLTGRAPGRTSDQDITLFKSLAWWPRTWCPLISSFAKLSDRVLVNSSNGSSHGESRMLCRLVRGLGHRLEPGGSPIPSEQHGPAGAV
jgi:hypothetical protein